MYQRANCKQWTQEQCTEQRLSRHQPINQDIAQQTFRNWPDKPGIDKLCIYVLVPFTIPGKSK